MLGRTCSKRMESASQLCPICKDTSALVTCRCPQNREPFIEGLKPFAISRGVRCDLGVSHKHYFCCACDHFFIVCGQPAIRYYKCEDVPA